MGSRFALRAIEPPVPA